MYIAPVNQVPVLVYKHVPALSPVVLLTPAGALLQTPINPAPCTMHVVCLFAHTGWRRFMRTRFHMRSVTLYYREKENSGIKM